MLDKFFDLLSSIIYHIVSVALWFMVGFFVILAAPIIIILWGLERYESKARAR